eukprot:TRINITY_DN10610_c0_g1_i4.p1 TRINITY_DN10610_c0_g1~~TRINITY_DN10610_c0_g1_i4.p1  ORF type:complete len:668 (+),score=112.95 TRINITY_DN10610_c0_g1_i4:134-2137(+)
MCIRDSINAEYGEGCPLRAMVRHPDIPAVAEVVQWERNPRGSYTKKRVPVTTTEAADAPMPEIAGPPAAPRPPVRSPWLLVIPPWDERMVDTFGKVETFTKNLVLAGMAVSVLLTFFISIMIGVGLNVAVTESSAGDSEFNALKYVAGSWGVASVLGIIRWFFKFFCHPRMYGIYAFCTYVILMGVIFGEIFDPHYNPANGNEASTAAEQIKRILENTLPYSDPANSATILQPFSMSFYDMVSAADIYNWLLGPVYGFVTAPKTNEALDGNLNVPTEIVNRTGGFAIWNVLNCELRQVRVEFSETNLQSVGICAYGEAAPCTTLAPGIKYTKAIKSIDAATLDTSVRYYTNGSQTLPIETYVDNKYLNSRDHSIDASTFNGFYQKYPGKSGQRSVGKAHTGVWVAGQFTDAEYQEQVQFMIDNQWIDTQTALVQLGCAVEVPNNNLLMIVHYSVEFTNTGLLKPLPVDISTQFISKPGYNTVDPILLMAWYYMIEELQDAVVLGARRYLWGSGISNLIDAAVIFLAIGTMFQYMVQDRYQQSDFEQHFWTQGSRADAFQRWCGFLCFFIFVKGLKFTANIPVMRTVGDTMGAAKWEVTLFLGVLALVILSFALTFNCVYGLQLLEYSTVGVTFLTLVRGMVGDLDYGAIYQADYQLGPFLYLSLIHI